MTVTVLDERINVETAERFLRLFEPNPTIKGVTKLLPGRNEHGKQNSKSWATHEQANVEDVVAHLEGRAGLGLAPIWEDGTAKFGAIDIDVYRDLDYAAIAKQITDWKLPLFVCSTKSGGAHVYLFLENRAPARAIVGYLRDVDKRLRDAGVYDQERVEIFPKQVSLLNGAKPSWINVPYFNAHATDRPCIDQVGNVLSLKDFIEQVEIDGLVSPDDIAGHEVVEELATTLVDDNWTAALERIGRDYPKAAGRSEAAIYLAGGLLRSGWDPKSTQAFIDTLHNRIGDEEVHDRRHIAAMTASKIEDGRDTAGWPKLARVVGWEAVEDLCVLLDIRPLPLSVDRVEARVKGGFNNLDKLADLIARAAFNGNDLKACTQTIAQETGTTASIVRSKIDAARSLAATSSGQEIVDEMNVQFAHVTVGDSPRIIWERPGEHYELIRKNALIDMHEGHKAFVPGRGWVNKGEYWFKHSLRRQYQRKVFKPGMETPGDYNTWQGFRYEPSEDGSWETLKRHILENVANGNEQHALWILAWFAHLIQHPMEKTGTALVILGRQGTGKTVIGQVFGALIRDHYMLVEDPKLVVGSFNQHLEDCLLLHADEAIFAKDGKAMARLRGLVTSERQTYEPKGVNAYTASNYTRVLITTQQHHAVEANVDERRFAIFETNDKRQQDHAFFEEMFKELETGGYARLLYDLQALDLSTTNLRKIPITAATIHQAQQSLDSPTRFFFEILDDGTMPWDVAYDHGDDGWPTKVEKKSFYEAYLAWGRKRQVRYPADQATFYRVWRRYYPVHVVPENRPQSGRFRHQPYDEQAFSKGRPRVLVFAPLGLMRERFTAATKISVGFSD